MNKFRLLPLVLAAAASVMTASAADKAPDIAIDQALKIAQDYLEQHGATADHRIVAITLEAGTLHSMYWYAHWQPAIGDGEHKETGLRIDLDGTVTRFVTGPSGGYDVPVGRRPVGARTMH